MILPLRFEFLSGQDNGTLKAYNHFESNLTFRSWRLELHKDQQPISLRANEANSRSTVWHVVLLKTIHVAPKWGRCPSRPFGLNGPNFCKTSDWLLFQNLLAFRGFSPVGLLFLRPIVSSTPLKRS